VLDRSTGAMGNPAQQRNRWQRGTVESVLAHRRMLCNPRFGGPGLLPCRILSSLKCLAGSRAGGLCDDGSRRDLAPGITPGAALFFVVSILFGVLLSMSAVGP